MAANVQAKVRGVKRTPIVILPDALATPSTLTVMDRVTGRFSDMPYGTARKQIAMGGAVEMIPSDPDRAKRWVAELRGRIMPRIKLEHGADLPAFEAYEAWCAERGFYALPAKMENLTLYLLGLMAASVPDHVIRDKARNIFRIHMLANLPPRRLMPNASIAMSRALGFAKTKLRNLRIAETRVLVAQTAIEMFPNGEIPMRWNDVAA